MQVTLLTRHKGVDLHALSAVAVLRERFAGGARLLRLDRAEFHTSWGAAGGEDEAAVARWLATGRIFNPNKHHYGHFRLAAPGEPWPARAGGCRGGPLPDAWPGRAMAADAGGADDGLADRLLGGGDAPPGAAVVDVCAFPLGAEGPLLSGVCWRLVVAPGDSPAAELARGFAVTRSAREGLLVNPHMEGWLIRAREA